MTRLALISALSAMMMLSAVDAQAAKVFRPGKARVALKRASLSMKHASQRLGAMFRPKALARGVAVLSLAAVVGLAGCATINVPVDGAHVPPTAKGMTIPAEKLPQAMQDKLLEVKSAGDQVSQGAPNTGWTVDKVDVQMPRADAPANEPIIINMDLSK